MNRLGFFLLVFLSFALLETFFQDNPRIFERKKRWLGNLPMALIGNLILKVIFPVGLVGFCDFLEEKAWGLFNFFEVPLETLISYILLDFWIWFQHVLTHKFQLLWKLHRVHHSDVELDVSSALRFHPIEILFSILFKMIIIVLFGIKAEAIVIFEVVLNGMAIFNHANLSIPSKLERVLRFFIVTPQMHLIHHNKDRKFSDTNYGFNLSLWDRVFKTYTENQPNDALIGQARFRGLDDQKPLSLLLQPFK